MRHLDENVLRLRVQALPIPHANAVLVGPLGTNRPEEISGPPLPAGRTLARSGPPRAWEAAMDKGDVREPCGGDANWAAHSRRRIGKGYRRSPNWLEIAVDRLKSPIQKLCLGNFPGLSTKVISEKVITEPVLSLAAGPRFNLLPERGCAHPQGSKIKIASGYNHVPLDFPIFRILASVLRPGEPT